MVKPSREHMEQVRKSVEEIMGPMPDASWIKGESLYTLRRHKKNEFLLHAGDVARNIYFVLKGVLRQFYISTRSDVPASCILNVGTSGTPPPDRCQ